MRVRKLGEVDRDRDAELASFAWGYSMAGGWRVPSSEFMTRSDVFGLFSGGRLIGGFVLGFAAPWRYLDMLPAEKAREFEASLNDRVAAEIACVWIDRAHQRRWRSYVLWGAVVCRATRSNVDALLVGAKTPKLVEAYPQVLGQPIAGLEYTGNLAIDGAEAAGWVALLPCPGTYRALWRMVRVKGRHGRAGDRSSQ